MRSLHSNPTPHPDARGAAYTDLPITAARRWARTLAFMNKGALVTVSEPQTAVHLIDRGMLSTSITVTLQPTDVLEFCGTHITGELVLRARPEDVDVLLARAIPERYRQYADRSAFFLYVPASKVIAHHMRRRAAQRER